MARRADALERSVLNLPGIDVAGRDLSNFQYLVTDPASDDRSESLFFAPAWFRSHRREIDRKTSAAPESLERRRIGPDISDRPAELQKAGINGVSVEVDLAGGGAG